MTENRFTYDKPLVAFSKGGIKDNVTGETYEFTMDTVLDLLNALHEENEQLKNNIKEAYQTERTALGKSVLKQLLNKME